MHRKPETANRRPKQVNRRRRAALVVFVQLMAAIGIVVAFEGTAEAGPEPVMEGYVPLPANELVTAFEGIRSGAGTTLDFTVGVTNAGSGAIMTYDHWEDGYENDLANPSQGSTLVFGDGNTANGNAASFCAACGGDLLPQGAPLIMRNNVATPRPASGATALFDGRDKIGSTRGFAITAGGFTTTRGSLQASVLSSYDTSKYANAYTIPIGTDTPVPSGASNPYGYAATLVQASEDGTVVQVDSDADGTPDVSQTIDEGEVVLTTGIAEGATIRSSKPVQVHMVAGDTTATYEAHSYTLFPDVVLTDDYISPAGTSVANFATDNFLYNPNDADITITPTCTGCSGTITVPANASAAFTSPVGRAVRFQSSGGEPFIATAAIGAHSGSEAQGATDNSSAWDWSFTMIPTSQLTTQVVLGWAPGNSNNPPSSPAANRNDNPVWVSTLTDTTVRVDFDGDPTTGAITTDDCFGNHDLEIPVTALASTRIIDNTDGDMTGARVYTCDGTLIAGAWGEDPQNAPTGSPGFDAGYTIIPSTTMIVDKTAAIANDPDNNNQFSPGDTVTYSVSIADAGNLAFTDVNLTDVLEPGMTYVPGSTTIDDGSTVDPYADDATPPAATAFPFDEGGNTLPSIQAGQTVIISFDVVIDAPALSSDGTISNTACVTAQEANACDTNEEDLTQADLELTKTVQGNPARVGDEASFLVTVENKGPDSVSLIEATDVLPAGTSYVSDNPSQGSYEPNTGLWEIGTLDDGDSATLEIVATIDQLSVTNFAEITDAAAIDIDSQPAEGPLDAQNPPDQDDEDSITVTVSPGLIDLSVVKTATDVGDHVGDEATFEVEITNDGPSVATGVQVTDQLPAGLSYVSSSATQGAYDDNTGIWTVGTLAVDGDATLTLVVQVNTDAEVTNVAQVSMADQTDADSTPNNDEPTEDDQDDAPVQVDPLIDLEVTKDLVTTPTYLGEDATFRVTVLNRGPSDATGVEVTDHFGADLDIVSATPAGQFDTNTGVWTVGDLASGDSASIDIVATVNDLDATNFAEVSDANEDDVDSQPAENPLNPFSPPDQDDEDRVSLTVEPRADLSLTKELTGSPSNLGDAASFEVTVSNDGPSPATGVEVTDQLPAGLTYVDSSATQGAYDNNTGLWTVGSLPVDGSATLTINVTVNITSALNVAEVTAVNENDPDSQPAEDPLDEQNPPNQDDEDEARVQVDELIDLSVTKTTTTTPTYVGDAAAFEIVVTNDGPSVATGVTISDAVPSGLAFVSSSATQGSYDNNTGIWTVGELAVDGTATLTVNATANAAGQVTNVAQVATADQTDTDSTPANDEPTEDDQDEVSFPVLELIDLSVTKAVITAPTYVGDAATYRVSVANAGPSTATGVVVTDLLPAGVTFVSSTAGQSYNANTGAWAVGTVASGATITMDIDVTVEGLSVLNLAQVTEADQVDVDSQPDEGPLDEQNPPDQDDEDQAQIDVSPRVDLSLTKVETASPAFIGDEASFTITVRNDGPSPATSVQVTDRLPNGLTYVSSDPSQGTYNPNTGIWTVGNLAVDASAELTLVATVQSASVRNVAEVTAVDQDDVDSQPAEDPLDDQNPPNQDDEDQAVVQVDALIDLSVDKRVTTGGTYVGDNVTFGVTVTNDGPSAATGVVVVDRLPAGLTFVSAAASQGTYDDTSGRWTIGDMAVDGTAFLAVTATVTSDAEITNIAQVVEADQTDTDSVPANNDPDEDDQDEASIDLEPRVDVSLTKAVTTSPTYLGDEAVFTLTVRNDGPSTATGVVVTDELPDGLTFVSASIANVYDPNTGEWTVGTIAAGDFRTLELTVDVETLSAVNYAEVTATNEDDIDSAPAEDPLDEQNPPNQDDEDQAPITVAPLADLSLTKGSSPSQVDQGDDATFTIVVRNDGPSPATGVEVTDQLPTGVTFNSSDPSQGSYNAQTGIWSVGNLAVGGEATLTIEVTVTAAGDITNVAQVTDVQEDDHDSTPDNDDPAEDDQDTTTLSSEPLIDLAVDKTISDSEAHVGTEVTYTVTVSNDGPSPATGVVVAEQLPAGTEHQSHDASVGSWDPATGAWEIGDLAVDAEATLEITVEVTAPGDITNVAQVVEADQRDVDSQPDEDPLGPNDPPNQDDEATVELTGILMDLELSIDADATTVGVGDPVTYTVTLTNEGPSDATEVSVDALLPPGVSFTGSNPSVGSYDPVTGIWTVGDLPVGTTVTLEITVDVTEAGEITMVSEVESAEEPDIDSTPDNDIASEDDQDLVVITGELADLSLTKSVSNPTPDLGSDVTYRLALTNDGPSDATGVVVFDLLPEGLTYVSHDGGTYDPATGRWDVGTVANGTTATLDIVVTVMATGTTTNVAVVTEADQPDPDSTPGPVTGEDDEDQVDVTPIPATLEGEIWLDVDGDGVFDDDESPIEGVLVELRNTDGDVVAKTVTDAEGKYRFDDLLPGEYTVVVDQTTLPTTIDGQTYDPDTVSDSQHTVILIAGENRVDVDFGYQPVAEPEPTPTTPPTAAAPPAQQGSLPRTGAEIASLVAMGLALLLGGVFLLAGRRRTQGGAA